MNKWAQQAAFPLVQNNGGPNPGAGQHLPVAIDPAARQRALDILHGPDLTATSTRLDALHTRLKRTSTDLDLVGHSADRAFNGSAQDIDTLTGKIRAYAHIASTPGDAVQASSAKASRSLDLVGHSAAANFSRAGTDADAFKAKVNGIPANKTVHVDLQGAQQGITEAQRLAEEINALHDKTVRLTTIRATGGHSVAGNAEGGYITGPGGPTSDSIPAWLSNGEYVVRAASVDRYGLNVMHAINAGTYARGGAAAANRNDLVLAAGGSAWSSRPVSASDLAIR
jgi:hypothetical protein